MNTFLLIGLGGALGSMARYGTGLLLGNLTGLFPLGTFTVNALGSMILGILYFLLENTIISNSMFSILAIGFCGGFTTFSAFSLEAFSLWKEKHVVEAFLYMLSSFLIGPAMIALGYAIGRLCK